MKDGTDAVADWPILNALLNAVNGASWVSVHHGGGVGMGLAIHAGLAVVAVAAGLGIYWTPYDQIPAIFLWSMLGAAAGSPIGVLTWSILPDTAAIPMSEVK